ncbi:MAG: LemA family protein [Bacilli bacterium]|nr:LemA family protein [Bacilli bacterium]
MTPFVVIIGVIVLLLFLEFNSIIYLKNRAKRSYSTIDVFLKKRFDLIPNLIETIKGYTKYEGETLENIVKLRNSFDDGDYKAGEKLNNTYNKLLALTENYPKLKASENFLHLQKQLTKVENEIAASRRLYINDVTNYNTKIQKFPHMIFALFIGARPMELLSFATEEVKVKF